ncbi:protein NLRC3 isoform X1 [Rhodamnia argentea]|uniref:Protein NLRC3 isoform X1 n=1 Tax=Rhodamnia argentea TaxID=178133 RepID=A0A8B8QSQ2_9MYRT|nr:protein NLRC3 isoform X1 [Rhodamnia argentea]
MKLAPSLVSLSLEAVQNELLRGYDVLPDVYELPAHLFDALVARLPPLSLHKLQNEMPKWKRDEYDADECFTNGRKRTRHGSFNDAWRSLFKQRWAELVDQMEPADWQQAYWEVHLQNCIDDAAEVALLPSFDVKLGEIRISDAMLKFIGYEWQNDSSTSKFSKLYQHCKRFGHYMRSLRLQNVLCIEETCHLLKNSRLESLVLRWIRTKDHVRALCQLLLQNRETLTSLEFIHCKLPSTFVNAICASLHVKGMQSHGIKQFSVHASSFLDSNTVLPSEFSSFLSSGRCLYSLRFCDVRLDRNFAELVFNTLLDASSDLSILDLSDNEIAGWLSSFTWKYKGSAILSTGAAKSLASLRVLNLRGNNLHKEDADNLRHALVHMPALRTLDLSENPIGDAGLRHLLPFLVEASGKGFPLADLSLENCELSSNGVIEFLNTLSTLDKSLSSLSISDNRLGSHVAEALVKLMGTSVQVLNIGGVGLGSSGFRELQKVMSNSLKLVKIDISKNRGGIESAKFLSKLIECAPELVAVSAAYNLMPPESLTVICSALEVAKGNLGLLDLRGNNLDKLTNDASILVDLQRDGKLSIVFESSPTLDAPYDDEP